MDYELLSIESEDAGKSHILYGTIVGKVAGQRNIETYLSGSEWGITADINIDDYGLYQDVPVFYHCQYSEKAGKDITTEGSPFVSGDRVVIKNLGDPKDAINISNLAVVGYEDGLPRPCVFQFRITRDDGTIIDKDLITTIRIRQEDPDNPGTYRTVALVTTYVAGPSWSKVGDTWYYHLDSYFTYDYSYNEATEIWTVPFMLRTASPNSITPKDGKDFWVFIEAADGEVGQLDGDGGYVYKTADYYQADHALVPKFYEAKTPYFKVISYDNTPYVKYPDDSVCGLCYTGNATRSVTVKSSIEYSLRLIVQNPGVSFWGKWIENCLLHGPDCAACQAAANALGDRYCKTDPFPIAIHSNVDIDTSWGDNYPDIGSNPGTPKIDVTKYVTPPNPYTATEATHSMISSYQGLNSYTITRACVGGGSIDFVLPYYAYNCEFGMEHINPYLN